MTVNIITQGIEMKKKLLWVEDEKDQFRAFAYKLSKEYGIERAIDFENAKELISNNKFDLIVVDIILPSGLPQEAIDNFKNITDIYYGIEFIQHVRSISKAVPIIVVSVVTEKEKIMRIKNIDDSIQFISKYDSTSDDVKELVDKILSKN